MEKLILEIAGLITSITVIITSINKIFTKKLEPINKAIVHLDETHCKDFLVSFLKAKERGEEMDEAEEKRAHEVYDHYSNDLGKNSYIHDKWNKVMKKGDEN